jgi:hypothetical protein
VTVCNETIGFLHGGRTLWESFRFGPTGLRST